MGLTSVNGRSRPASISPPAPQYRPGKNWYPPVSGHYRAWDYGVRPGSDVTSAFQTMVSDLLDVAKRKTIEFLPGEYLFSDQINFLRTSDDMQESQLSLFGIDRVTFRLIDLSPNFSDPESPLGLIKMNTKGSEQGGEGYHNNIENIDFILGRNPGAFAVDWLANNVALMRDVYIDARNAYAGVVMDRITQGPCLLDKVHVEGGQFGFIGGGAEAVNTMRDCSVSGQTVAGIDLDGLALTIHGFTSVNSVPAICGDSGSTHICIIDADLSGGSASSSAIELTNSARMYARNINATGYASAVSVDGTPVEGTQITEYVSQSQPVTPQEPYTALNLPSSRIPSRILSDPLDWVSAADFGDLTAADVTATIQAALDSGAPGIYIPRVSNDLAISDTLTVNANKVSQIDGMWNYFVAVGGTMTDGRPVFEISNGSAQSQVEFRHFQISGSGSGLGFPRIVNDTPATVVLSSIHGGSFESEAGAGVTYIEDVLSNIQHFRTRTVCWQLNPEPEGDHLIVEGCECIVYGLKTEGGAGPEGEHTLRTISGGKSEILGGFASWVPLSTPIDIVPFVNVDSDHSICFAGNTESRNNNMVSETHGGSTVLVPRSAWNARGNGRQAVLYVYRD